MCIKLKVWNSRRIRDGIAVSFMVLVFCCAAGKSHANFEDTGIGARQVAMGGAFSAVADDIYTIYYNPAGLEKLRWMELGVFAGNMHEGLTDNSSMGNNFVGFTYPLQEYGTIGISWLNFALNGYYAENTYTLGYAMKIRDPLDAGLLSVGINLKLLTRKFGETAYTEGGVNLDTGYTLGARDPLFENGYGISGLSMDLGLLYTLMFAPEHSFALVIRDLNNPDMGLGSRDNIGIADNVGQELRAGYAYTAGQLNCMVDVSFRSGLFVSMGVEKLFLGGIYAIRGGYSIGAGGLSKMSCGAMYRNSGVFQLDYGFALPTGGVVSTLGSHRISITFRFGPNVPVMVDRTARLRGLERKVESVMEEISRTGASDELPGKKESLNKVKENVTKIKQKIRMSEEKKKAMVEKYYRNGLVEYSRGNVEKAIWHWESALRVDPGNEKVRNALAQAKREL